MNEDKLLEDDDLLLSSPKLQFTNSQKDSSNKINPWQSSPGGGRSESGPCWDEFSVDSILGEGAYGKVYKVHKK